MSEVTPFGFSMTAEGDMLIISMYLLVALVVGGHFTLSALDDAVNKSAFRRAIQSLYKDLVIMGITSFSLTISTSAGLSFGSWLVYLQIADITLFIATVVHVCFAMALIFANSHQIREIREHLAKNVHVVVQNYKDGVGNLSWILVGSLRRQIELRVLQIAFLTKFNLSRSFDFARYITIAQENNIVEMLEVSSTSWIFFLVIFSSICMGFQFNEVRYMQSVLHELCDGYDPEKTDRCESASYQSILFTIATALMFLFTLALAMMSRIYVLRLLRESGCDMNELDQYLIDDEIADLENHNADRISFKELKTAVTKLKLSHKEKKSSLNSMKNKRSVSMLWRKTKLVKIVARIQVRDSKICNSEYSDTTPDNISEVDDEVHSFKSNDIDASSNFSRDCSNDSLHERKTPPPSPIHTPSIICSPRKEDVAVMDASSVKMAAIVERSDDDRRMSQLLNARRVQMMAAGVKSGIFFFDSPALYFMMRDSGNLLLCLFLSFYVVTFSEVASYTTNVVLWCVLPLLCLVGALRCQVYTIRSSSLLFSFSRLDSEILARVVEEKEELETIHSVLREKLLNKITNAAEQSGTVPEVALMQLFNEIQRLDGAEDGYISKSEMRVLFQRLNIHFTNRRFDDAFGLMDTQADGMISLVEFHAFIFSSDAKEKLRLQRLQRLSEVGRYNAQNAVSHLQPRIKRRTALSNIHRYSYSRPAIAAGDALRSHYKTKRKGMAKLIKDLLESNSVDPTPASNSSASKASLTSDDENQSGFVVDLAKPDI